MPSKRKITEFARNAAYPQNASTAWHEALDIDRGIQIFLTINPAVITATTPDTPSNSATQEGAIRQHRGQRDLDEMVIQSAGQPGDQQSGSSADHDPAGNADEETAGWRPQSEICPASAAPTSTVKSTTPTPSLNRLSPSTSSDSRFGTPSRRKTASTEIGSVGAINAPKTSATGNARPNTQVESPPTTSAVTMVPSTEKSNNGHQFSRKRFQCKLKPLQTATAGAARKTTDVVPGGRWAASCDNPSARPAITNAEAYGNRNRRATIATNEAININQKNSGISVTYCIASCDGS